MEYNLEKIDKKYIAIVGIAVILILGLLVYFLFFQERPFTPDDAKKLTVQKLEEAQIAEQLTMLLNNSGQCQFDKFYEAISPHLLSEGVTLQQLNELKPNLEAKFEEYKSCSPKLEKEVIGELGPKFIVNYYLSYYPEECNSVDSGKPVLIAQVDGNDLSVDVLEAEIFQGNSGKFTQDNMSSFGACIGPFISATKVNRN